MISDGDGGSAWENGRIIPPGESPTFVETWKEMEKLLDTGKVKSIGVSNFSIKTLNELLPHCAVIPATNQVEIHPCLPSFELQEFCESKGILLTAYSPFGQNSDLIMKNPELQSIADKHSGSVGQICVSWNVQRGIISIPKSSTPERQKSNISLVKLSNDEMKLVNDLHKKPDMHRSTSRFYHSGPTVFGWTYDQLGWPLVKGGFVEESKLTQ